MQNARIEILSPVFMESFPFPIFAMISLSGAIPKSIEGNLMELDRLIEGHEGNCRMQEP